MAKISIKAVLASTLALGLAFASAGAAQAAPRVNEKVTICHRTHATTNPYRQITVSMSSIVGNGNSGNGHGNATQGGGQDDSSVSVDHSHNPYYTAAGSVFNPTFTYPSNHKQWQDIIPPFNYVPANGNTGTYAGLNWDAVGKAIYYGYTYNGVNYAGLCSKMSAKQFAQKEYASFTADNPNANNSSKNASKNDAAQDVKDQGADEDGNTNGKNFDTLPDPAQKPKGPDAPNDVKNLQDDLDAHNTANPNDIKQAIAGVVWEDTNRNGLHEQNERLFDQVGIELIDPLTGSPYVEPVSYRFKNKPGALLVAGINIQTVVTTFTVYTDVNGYFHIDNVPEGDWTVRVITPTGYSYTYDSNGTGDGAMPGTYVPAGGLGFAWAGLVQGPQTSTGNSGGTTGTTNGTTSDGSSLANTGTQVPFGTMIFGVLLTLAGGYVVSRRR